MEIPSLKVFMLTYLIYGFSHALTEDQIKNLDNLISTVVKCRKVPGLAVAVVRKDETVYTRGFGIREQTSGENVTERTLFNLASESKAFTATVAADAVARGKITWDASVRKVLGSNFRLQDDIRSEHASLRDFLSHRMGAPGYWNIAAGLTNLTRRDILERVAEFPTSHGFRDRYHYSNYMYVTAAAIVETAACESWEDAIYNRLFKPLGMTDSRLSTRLSDEDWGHIAYSNVVLDNGTFIQVNEKQLIGIANEFAPAAGVYSNAKDMAKWMRFHLNDGKNEKGEQIVDAKTLKDTYHPTNAEYSPYLTRARYPVDDMLFSYAMGWRNGIYNGYKKLVHTAAYNNYQGTLTLLPEKGLGVWVQISGAADGNGRSARNVITMYALDLLLGDTPWLNVSTACSFPAPWVVPPTPAPPTTTTPLPTLPPGWGRPSIFINLTEYPGTYHSAAFGNIDIWHEEEEYGLFYSYGELMTGYLIPKGGNREDFLQTLTGPLAIKQLDYSSFPDGFPVRFHRDNDGALTGVQFNYLSFSNPPIFSLDEPSRKENLVTHECLKPTTVQPKINGETRVTFSVLLVIMSIFTLIAHRLC